VDGINYGPIEAVLDREQTSNVWITFAIREGKNREVRNVLRHLGLQVARLIRVSFGPFQLGDIAEGAVEEVPTRILRDQLGARRGRAGGVVSAPRIMAREAESTARRAARPARVAEAPSREKPDKHAVHPDKNKFYRPRRGEGARPGSDDRGRSPARKRVRDKK